MRRIPLDQVKPELLEKKGKLVEAFCAGVWGGMGESGAHCPAGKQLTPPVFPFRLHSPTRLPCQQIPRTRDRRSALGAQGPPC